jgi:endogenous inhibitor of DNA gyrase (YacG/DUF329 family)
MTSPHRSTTKRPAQPCKQCGRPVKPKQRGRAPAYCSLRCYRAYVTEHGQATSRVDDELYDVDAWLQLAQRIEVAPHWEKPALRQLFDSWRKWHRPLQESAEATQERRSKL